MIDEHIRYKLNDHMTEKTAQEFLHCLTRTWFRYFGPMEYMVMDQEPAATSDLRGVTCDRFSIRRVFAGTDAHAVTGLAESHIRLTKLVALKPHEDCQREGLNVSKHDILFEAAMS